MSLLRSKKKSIRDFFNEYGKNNMEIIAPIKLQCKWSKILRFAPGVKVQVDELFQV